ncbi:hypothetical protein GCM10010191_35680 [Actinomadura vinacea]|uniref:Lipoprotein n=1 Tax=Actinomadura vinacea TaxID=115336 RepID=A0ABN3J2X7_9ACTN
MVGLPVRGRAAFLLLLPMILGTAGCFSGGGGPAPVPQGFQRYQTDQYSFAYPAGWRRTEDKDERGRPQSRFEGPGLPSGIIDGQIHVAGYGRVGQEFETALSQFRGLAVLNRYRLTANRAIKVAGAVRAHRFEAVYELEAGDGTRVPCRLVGMYVLTERKVLLEFMLRSPAQGTAASRLPEIFDSIRIRET